MEGRRIREFPGVAASAVLAVSNAWRSVGSTRSGRAREGDGVSSLVDEEEVAPFSSGAGTRGGEARRARFAEVDALVDVADVGPETEADEDRSRTGGRK